MLPHCFHGKKMRRHADGDEQQEQSDREMGHRKDRGKPDSQPEHGDGGNFGAKRDAATGLIVSEILAKPFMIHQPVIETLRTPEIAGGSQK